MVVALTERLLHRPKEALKIPVRQNAVYVAFKMRGSPSPPSLSTWTVTCALESERGICCKFLNSISAPQSLYTCTHA